MNIDEEEYKRYTLFAKKIAGNDWEDTLHDTLAKIITKPEIKKGKDAYIWTCIYNHFLDQKRKNKNVFFVEINELEQKDHEELKPFVPHIFGIIKQLEIEGHKLHTDRFIQATFAMTQTELSTKQLVSQSVISKSCTFVKNEIKKRYDYDKF